MRCIALALVTTLTLAACKDIEMTAPREPAPATVPQFSAAPGFGTTTDLEDLLGLPSLSLASGFENGFRHQIVAQWDNAEAVDRILRRWLTSLVNARLKPATTDNELFLALSDYKSWFFSAQTLVQNVEGIFHNEIDAFEEVVADKLARAIDGNLTVCRTQQSFGALANVLMWYGQAEELVLISTPYWTITDDAMRSYIQQFCLAVEVQSVQFPNPVNVGQSFTLSTTAAVRFAGQAATLPAAFQMDIGFNPPGTFLPSAFTDAAGSYQTPMTFTTPGLITVTAIASLVLPGRTEASFLVSGAGSAVGNAMNPPPPPPPPPSSPVDVTGRWEADFSYTGSGGFVAARITLNLSQSGASVGGSWVLDDGVHSGSISFTVGGIDPACPGCGYKITNFEMKDSGVGRWFLNPSTGVGHVGEPARGVSIRVDLGGSDTHGPEIVHTWLYRPMLLRLIEQ